MGAQQWIDASAGVAGDMLLGAPLDASPVRCEGLAATLVTVTPEKPSGHDRAWAEIAGLLHQAELAEPVRDPAVVVTEPFSEWDLAGRFVAGRPAWEECGAVLTEDVRPFETRKLWLLNGAHSLLAYAGSIRGHATVAEAMADEVVSGWVRQWWEVAIPHLTRPEPELREYADALADRFANPAIRHLLAQIAADGSQKLPVRIVPALRASAEAGADAADGTLDGGLRAVAAWVLHARGAGAPLVDADEAQVRELVSGELGEALTRVLRHWGLDLGLAARLEELAAGVQAEAPGVAGG